jgi:phosphoglycolate phosphatase
MNLLFDLDGTLVDSREGIVSSLRFAFEALGLPVPDEQALAATIGPPLHVALAGLLVGADASLLGRCVAAYREHYAQIGAQGHRVYPGVAQTLHELQARGATLFVATSKPVIFARRILAGLGLDRHFHAIHGSELDGTRADKAELIAHVIASERLHPHACTMIGDRRYDVAGAHANAIRSLGVSWGFGTRAELESAGAQAIIDRPEQLLARIAAQ